MNISNSFLFFQCIVRYAATLLPGSKDQKPVPELPFLGASLALGMFALSPYLALRERRPVRLEIYIRRIFLQIRSSLFTW